MKLAVLMSTYNGERFLHQQIESILKQVCSFQVDLWVRDDGSTDGTQMILQSYADDGELQWYTGPNLGPARSFLDLVQHCEEYDFYAFADQDDYWYPEKLETGVKQIKEHIGPALYFSNGRMVDMELNPLGRNIYRTAPPVDFYSVTCGAGITGCTMVFNRELAKLIQEKPLPKELVMHDYHMGIVCTLHDGVVIYDDDAWMDYRQHGNNVVGCTWRKRDALKNRIRQLTEKNKPTLDKAAEGICEIYRQVPDMQKLQWLKTVSRYRTSFCSAMKFALDPKPKYSSKNMAFTLRLAFLLRNR